jgi:hypothetical protein
VPFLTKTELASVLGVTRPRVYHLIKMGLPVRADGKLDRDKSIAWIASNIRPHEKPETGEERFSDARRRKEIALANLREHELSVKRGTVVLVADVERAWCGIMSVVRQQLLGLPSRCAALVAGANAAAAHGVLEDAVREILTELSQTSVAAVESAANAANLDGGRGNENRV